ADAKASLRADPDAERVRDDWGAESFAVRLLVDADKANMAGLTNRDVAASSAAGMNGSTVATLREGDKQIPVMARLRMHERAGLADVRNLYVHATHGERSALLEEISRIDYGLETERIQRRNQFRTITVQAFPRSGVLPSRVLSRAMPALRRIEAALPPGY